MKGKKTERPVEGKYYKNTKLMKIFDEFLQSGDDCWEIEMTPGEYVSKESMYSSLLRSSKRVPQLYGVKIDVVMAARNVFLMRKN